MLETGNQKHSIRPNNNQNQRRSQISTVITYQHEDNLCFQKKQYLEQHSLSSPLNSSNNKIQTDVSLSKKSKIRITTLQTQQSSPKVFRNVNILQKQKDMDTQFNQQSNSNTKYNKLSQIDFLETKFDRIAISDAIDDKEHRRQIQRRKGWLVSCSNDYEALWNCLKQSRCSFESCGIVMLFCCLVLILIIIHLTLQADPNSNLIPKINCQKQTKFIDKHQDFQIGDKNNLQVNSSFLRKQSYYKLGSEYGFYNQNQPKFTNSITRYQSTHLFKKHHYNGINNPHSAFRLQYQVF